MKFGNGDEVFLVFGWWESFEEERNGKNCVLNFKILKRHLISHGSWMKEKVGLYHPIKSLVNSFVNFFEPVNRYIRWKNKIKKNSHIIILYVNRNSILLCNLILL